MRGVARVRCRAGGRLLSRLREHDALGLNLDEVQVSGPPKFRNSALLLLPGGMYAGRYDKVHRVPWGEYVPLKDWIPAMNFFAPYDHDYRIAPGDEMTRFPLGKYSFGTLICQALRISSKSASKP